MKSNDGPRYAYIFLQLQNMYIYIYVCVCVYIYPLYVHILKLYTVNLQSKTYHMYIWDFMSRTNLGSAWLVIWTSPSTAEPQSWDLQTFSVNDKWLGGTIGCHIWQWQTSSKAIHKTHLVSPPKGSPCGGRKAKRKINQTLNNHDITSCMSLCWVRYC